MRLSSCLIVCLIVLNGSAAESTPGTPIAKSDGEWQQKHAANVATAKAGGVDVLFLGDSITEYWNAEGKAAWTQHFAPLKAANFGVAADKVENVLWRVQNGELDGIQPKVVVLLCGINNTWGLKRETRESGGIAIAAGLGEVIHTIHAKSPQTKVLLLAILPMKDGVDLSVVTANNQLKKMDDKSTVRFLDIGPNLADAAGNLLPENTKDGLHLSAKGYEIFAGAIAPALAEMLKK